MGTHVTIQDCTAYAMAWNEQCFSTYHTQITVIGLLHSNRQSTASGMGSYAGQYCYKLVAELGLTLLQLSLRRLPLLLPSIQGWSRVGQAAAHLQRHVHACDLHTSPAPGALLPAPYVSVSSHYPTSLAVMSAPRTAGHALAQAS